MAEPDHLPFSQATPAEMKVFRGSPGSNPKNVFPLLALPSELRGEIYLECCLENDFVSSYLMMAKWVVALWNFDRRNQRPPDEVYFDVSEKEEDKDYTPEEDYEHSDSSFGSESASDTTDFSADMDVEWTELKELGQNITLHSVNVSYGWGVGAKHVFNILQLNSQVRNEVLHHVFTSIRVSIATNPRVDWAMVPLKIPQTITKATFRWNGSQIEDEYRQSYLRCFDTTEKLTDILPALKDLIIDLEFYQYQVKYKKPNLEELRNSKTFQWLTSHRGLDIVKVVTSCLDRPLAIAMAEPARELERLLREAMCQPSDDLVS